MNALSYAQTLSMLPVSLFGMAISASETAHYVERAWGKRRGRRVFAFQIAERVTPDLVFRGSVGSRFRGRSVMWSRARYFKPDASRTRVRCICGAFWRARP